jgi:RNA polymerase sigma-70 factor (ECF subfamily)
MLDEELVEAARGGNRRDVEALICAVWAHAFRIALSVLRDRGLAEDAAQEACAIVFRSIKRLRSAQAFKVWFYRIVVREALEIERRRVCSAEIDEMIARESEVTNILLRVDVHTALASLSPPQRAAVALHYYAGLNSAEIGIVLRMPGSSVRFHIMNAKRVLQESLREHREHRIQETSPHAL